MLKTLNMVVVCCPVGFFEEIIALALLQMKNKYQIDTENDKNPKIFHFSKKFLTDFVDWNVSKGHAGKSWLSSLFRRVYCNFLNENVSN